MTHTKILLHCFFHNPVILPRFFSIKWIICTVKAVDRREYSQFYPSGSQFIISVSKHMTTNVMAPPSISDIAGICSEIWLELQTLPCNNRITRESNGISVASRTCISGKGKLSLAFPYTVKIVIMVQHPKGIQTRYFRNSSLLPVKPPEIYAVFFHRMMQIIKINLKEFIICYVKKYRLFLLRIHSHFLCNTWICFFIWADSICRMNIQCYLHIMVMKPFQEFRRIRKQLFVPGIACPSASIYRIHILNKMPVHINNSY